MSIPRDVVSSLENGEWYFCVIEYGVTHGRLLMGFHQGDFLRRLEIVGVGSVFFGPLEGGPSALVLHASTDGSITRIEASGCGMTWRFESARLLEPRSRLIKVGTE